MKLTHSVYTVAKQLMRRPKDKHWGTGLYEAVGMKPGTCYPILMRMLAAGWLTDEWETPAHARRDHPGSPPRHYYTVTDAGMLALQRLITQWETTREYSS
jgi:DNA-binding PadR family transcriptional regulator